MNERDAFLGALAANEDETLTRLVFADWLDDRGEHEESDRHRRWPAAKEWLVRFCRENNPAPDDADEYGEWVIDYPTLLELGREAIAGEDKWGIGFSCGNNMGMCDALWEHSGAFWKNWSVVTGIPVPTDIESKSGYSCAC